MDNKTMHEQFVFRMEKQDNKAKLYIYGAIQAKAWDDEKRAYVNSGANALKDQLDEIPAGAEIELHINSNGGEVNQGVAIYNLLRRKAAEGCRINGYVDGAAYSAAVNVACAADHLVMGQGTTMLVHNPWTIALGNANDLREAADQLDKMGMASMELYLSRCNGKISREELKEMMDKETMLTAEECVKYGFADEIVQRQPDPDDDPEAKQLKTFDAALEFIQGGRTDTDDFFDRTIEFLGGVK